MRRLLARQYDNSIAYLLGATAAASATPPADTELNGFSSIAASQNSLTDDMVASYEASARAVASAAMQDMPRIDALVACQPASVDDKSCHASFVRNFGRLAWRRPLASDEINDYVGVAVKGALQKNDFHAGVELALSAMLQSPNFLFQVEIGAPDPDRADIRRLTGLEVASRMSFLLLDRTPDAELLDAAQNGELDSADGVRGWAEKLLAEPEAKAAVRDFFGELFVLDDLSTQPKDPTLFAAWSPSLAASMREEALRIIDDAVWSDAPMPSILTSTQTHVDQNLAALYGVPAPSDGQWESVVLPAEQGRSGILTSAAVMARQAHSTSTSATRRGLWIMQSLLCTTMPPPPQNVNLNLPPSSAAPTLRDRIKIHQTDPVCRTCHYTADNIGLSFEHFDGIGRYRAQENGADIDVTGAVAGIGNWQDPQSLGRLLAGSDKVTSCLTRQLYRYATGHVEVDGEWPALNDLSANFAQNDYRFRSLLLDMVSSDLFREVGAPP